MTWQFEFRVLGSDATLWTTASRPGGPVPPYGWWYLTLVDLTSGASTNGGAVWNLADGHYYRLDVLVASMTTPAGDYGYGVGTFGSTFTNAVFRRAAVPEPGSAAIFGAALCAALIASGMRHRPHAHLGTASQARPGTPFDGIT